MFHPDPRPQISNQIDASLPLGIEHQTTVGLHKNKLFSMSVL